MAEETHPTGLPVWITVDDNGHVTFAVDLTEASVPKSYDDDEVSDRFIELVERAITTGNYTVKADA